MFQHRRTQEARATGPEAAPDTVPEKSRGTAPAAFLAAVLTITALCALPAAASERATPSHPHREAAPPIGFGSIPFGTQANAVLALNNGNGNLVFPPQGPATFRYPVVLAGLQFQVTQNFDDDNRAINALAVYASGEDQRSCVARFNYILAGLNARYGPPTVIPDVVQEVRGGNVVGSYAAQYDFNDRTSIRATVETTVPAEAGGAGGNCQIALNYYPPGWLAGF